MSVYPGQTLYLTVGAGGVGTSGNGGNGGASYIGKSSAKAYPWIYAAGGAGGTGGATPNGGSGGLSERKVWSGATWATEAQSPADYGAGGTVDFPQGTDGASASTLYSSQELFFTGGGGGYGGNADGYGGASGAIAGVGGSVGGCGGSSAYGRGAIGVTGSKPATPSSYGAGGGGTDLGATGGDGAQGFILLRW